MKWALLAAAPFLFLLAVGAVLIGASNARPEAPVMAEGQLCVNQRCRDVQALKLHEAQVVNLNRARELVPTVKVNGIASGSVRIGWFEYRSGRAVYVAVHSPRDVIYLPTTLRHDFLFNAPEPEKFLMHLRTAQVSDDAPELAD